MPHLSSGRALSAAGVAALLCGAARLWAAEPALVNGGFEDSVTVQGAASGDAGFGPWALAGGSRAPAAWTMNPAFPGELSWVEDGAHGGRAFVRLRANGRRGSAHMYQPCPGLVAGECYRLSLWVRGGPAHMEAYEYRANGSITTPRVLSAEGGPTWHEVRSLYSPAGDDLKGVALAIVAEQGGTLDVDDVSVQRVAGQVPPGLTPVTFQTDDLRLTLTPHGTLQEFGDRRTGRNYAVGSTPVFRIAAKGAEMPVRYVQRSGDLLEVHFADPQVVAWLRCEARPGYLTFTVERVQGEGVEWLGLCDLRLDITQTVGTLVNAAWDDHFAACVLACNERTHSFGADASRAVLMARCYADYGLVGARIAVLGVALDPPGSPSRLLDAIEKVELGEGLPHLTRNGVWIKRAPERLASYVMAAGASEANIDRVVEFARGGFGCVEILNWWHSTPTYDVDRGLFPHGWAGLQACAEKIHAAGMQVGMHCMQGMVGWGGVGMGDPHVSPVADPRLLQDRRATLAAEASATASELAVREDASGWPEAGDLLVEGEVIRYAGRTAGGFTGCTRGLWGTHARGHAAGASVGHLVNVFSMWGNCIYAPDVNTTLLGEACDNLARAFDAAGADMSYFDGGEEVAAQPPDWHNQGRVALGVQKRVRKPLILSGNALYTHLSWHVITRGSPTFDPIYFGRRDYTLRGKGQNPASWAPNLLTGDVGWFAAHTWSPSTDAVTPDEVMLLCLKAVGGKSPLSFQVDCNHLWVNRRMPEMLQIIRACDEIKRGGQFSEQVCAELARPMAEHVLDRAPDGRWQVRPLQFGPPRMVDAADGAKGAVGFGANPYGPQRPWVRIRARARLAAYGAPENVVLADFRSSVPLRAAGTGSGDLAVSAHASVQKAPDGAACCQLQARSNAAGPSSWARLSLTLPRPLDLTAHRPLGLWVYSEGRGGLLNVQLVQGYGFRDHYIPLDYSGWRRHVLDPAETTRFYEHAWPYNFVDLFYWVFQYGAVSGLNLYLNDLPPGQETRCLVSRIEALREFPEPLRNPGLEGPGGHLSFPVELAPEEYLELDWDGACRHFERNGGLLETLRPEGDLRLAPGDGALRLTCSREGNAGTRAEVTVCLRGQPLANSAPPPAGAAVEPPAGDAGETPDDVRLAAGDESTWRLMRGPYELVGGPPAHPVSAFDGVSNAWSFPGPGNGTQRAAVVISRPAGVPEADYDAPGGRTLEAFGDLSPYQMSARNDFEKYVIGGGKELASCGPVREGVVQSFTSEAGGGRAGGPCAAYSATNSGGPGGWCAKGRRFAAPVDLSAFQAISFWLHGDGKRETLRFQFRDAAGVPADWLVPIDFTGSRREVLRTADRPDFDWRRAEYLIFYYNDIPAGATVELRFEGVRALPALLPGAPLSGLRLTLNGGDPCELKGELRPGESWLLDGAGGSGVWEQGQAARRLRGQVGGRLEVRPGENRAALTCAGPAPPAVTVNVRVVTLGEL